MVFNSYQQTIFRFLERFVYRNPKTTKKDEGEENILKYYQLHSRMRFIPKSHRFDIAANTTQFLEKENFHPEDIFFQKLVFDCIALFRFRLCEIDRNFFQIPCVLAFALRSDCSVI